MATISPTTGVLNIPNGVRHRGRRRRLPVAHFCVRALSGTIAHLTSHFTDSPTRSPRTFDVLFVGPQGGSEILLSGVGPSYGENEAPPGLTLNVDDSAASALAESATLPTNSAALTKPVDYAGVDTDTFPSPAPASPGTPAPRGYATPWADEFDGTNPDGTWSLYVVTDGAGDGAGEINGGWSLTFTTRVRGHSPTRPSLSSPDPSFSSSAQPERRLYRLRHQRFAGDPGHERDRRFHIRRHHHQWLRSGRPQRQWPGRHAPRLSPPKPTSRSRPFTAGRLPSPESYQLPRRRKWTTTPTVVAPNQFANPGAITLNNPTSPTPTPEPASPYPSNIYVSNLGPVTGLTVTLKGITYPFSQDLDVLLVGPQGQSIVLLSNVGPSTGTQNASNVTLTFSDAAASAIPKSTPLGSAGSSVTTKPVDYSGPTDVFPSPAPGGGYGDPAPKGSATLGGTFDGTNPNGAWSLYAVTVGEGDGTGSIAGDWSIDFAVSSQTVSFSTTAPSPGVAGNTYAASASATSTLPVTYSIDSSSTSGTCSVNATGQVSFLAAGTCVLDANQSGDGNWSAAPQAQQVITVVSPPGAPTGLTASAGDAQVALSWLGPTNNGGAPLTLYNIYEGTSPGGETLLTSISAVCSGVGCGKVQSFVATGLTNGTTYYFEVTAVNSVGESSPSNEVSATPATLPGAPTGLAAAPGNTQVALSWTAPPSNGGSAITSYNVYEGTSSGGETLLQSTGSSATTFTATGLTNGTQYYFEVTAVNGVGEGPVSTEASATPATVPAAPTALTATASDTQVALTWTAPTNNGGEPVTSYNIYQGTSSGGETLLQNTASTATTFTSTGLTNGTTYYFKVTAVNSVGESLSSNEVSATPAVVPGAPTTLTATAGNAQVALVWGAPTNSGGDPVIGYQIYQGTSPGGETLLTSTSTTTAAYTSTGLSNGTTYYFVVSAVTSAGEGPFSNEASATPATLPGAPTGLTATGGDTQVVLDWAAPASNGGSAIMFYNVYEGTAPGAETLLGSTGTTSTTFTPTGLTNGTKYYFEVAAVNGVGQGPVSNETSATPATPPGAPTGLTATRGNTQVALAWNAPTASGGEPVTSYNIYQGTVPGAETLLTRTNGTSYTSAGLTNGTEYYFVVTAVNGVGESLVSNEASATPATVPGARPR